MATAEITWFCPFLRWCLNIVIFWSSSSRGIRYNSSTLWYAKTEDLGAAERRMLRGIVHQDRHTCCISGWDSFLEVLSVKTTLTVLRCVYFWGLSRVRQEIFSRTYSIAPWNCTSASAKCCGLARISRLAVTSTHPPHALLFSCVYPHVSPFCPHEWILFRKHHK